ncbi:glycerophosphodiester phosphodiesterase family protein [Thaumasiovibrio subtropicus]|uniref:glycerophosphodiester phosphodiesterase family protein n=1 Tax=Thaumasiovibrio subtropicus TaxID=1891207 RepID=UPI000B34C7BF|nr:glycerophosphodiester phosphodiesterase family protein [Thaumasiovibrio subtropicus]
MKPRIIGHRGAAGTHPENTLSAINEAIRLGLHWVEVDIQMTADKVLIVCHDFTVDRCSNGQGRVDSLTLEALRRLDFGRWFHQDFKNEPLLTLEMLLSLGKRHRLRLNLELKTDQTDNQIFIDLVSQQLAQSTMDPAQILLSSFDHDLIEAIGQRCPQFRRGLISDHFNETLLNRLEQVGAFSCHLNYSHLDNVALKQLQDHGYEVWCYTVNNADDFPLLKEVDAIFTDYPATFINTNLPT